MIYRHLTEKIKKNSTHYPVILVTGPRQSGKTTLVRNLFSHYTYHNLEFPDVRELARLDPRSFLSKIDEGMVIDEIQYVPELLSYIQGLADARQLIGKVVITGSQNFALMEKVTQSLAGRVAVFELLPLSFGEIKTTQNFDDVNDIIVKGGYPRLYSQPNLNAVEWLRNYIQTYIERDVRQLLNVKDIDKFSLFLRLCAGRTGQLVNYAALGNEAGVDAKTAQQWLAILKASFIVFTVNPYYENFNKRLVKTPKLYFYDTGLAAFLLQVLVPSDLQSHHARGALFENWVVMELMKYKTFIQDVAPLYFWRDRSGNEIDIIHRSANRMSLIEVKASQTFNSSFFKVKTYWNSLHLSIPADFNVVYAGEPYSDPQLVSWKDIEQLAQVVFSNK